MNKFNQSYFMFVRIRSRFSADVLNALFDDGLRQIEIVELEGITFCITLCEKFCRFVAVRGVM